MKIRTRLVLVILIAAFLTLSIFAALQIKYQYDRDYQQFVEKIEYYDRLVAEFMRLPLWNLDRASVDVGVQGLLSEPDIVAIDVRDNLGIVHEAHAKPGKGTVVKHLISVYGDGTIIGTVEISYRANLLSRNLGDATIGFAVLVLVLLLVLSATIFLAAWTITSPLYRIIGMVRDIGKHIRTDHMVYPFKGELADLAESINSMSDDLRDHEITIQQVSAASAANEMKLRMEQELRRQSDAHRVELQNSLDTLKQAQQQLITAEKMALLGSLVAGVSHEINTPIGVSVTAASFLADKTQEFTDLLESGKLSKGQLDSFVSTIEESLVLVLGNLERAASLIRSFKQISVDQASESLRTFNFGAYIAEVIRSLQPSLRGKDLDLQVVCPDNLAVCSYPGAFSQILTNLIINSIVHGFEQRNQGCIKIEVSVSPENCIDMIYADNGKGMTEAALKHLFEPFFTSMRNSGGSGLGSYIIYNLVTQTLEGTIHAENLVSGGLQYSMHFPFGQVNAAVQ